MGRKALIITFIILITFISSSVKACNFDYTYYYCTGTCQAGYTCKNTAPETCTCVSNNPTSTPAPSPTSARASPTVTTMPIGGYDCSNPPAGCTSTDYCMALSCNCPYCGLNNGKNCTPNCSASCNNGHCYVTNPNPTVDVRCGPPPTPASWTDWICLSGASTCAACSAQGYLCAIRYCTSPPNSNQYEVTCGWPASCNGGGGGGGGSNPTNTPTPTATPTPGPFAKLKNTSFYSSRALIQPIPASPLPFDSDDNASPYFIIASPGSDPGIVSASFISLGAGQPSVKNWKTTESSNNIIFSPASFLSYIKTRTNLKTISSLADIQNQNINNQAILLNTNATIDDSNKNIFDSRRLVVLVNGNLNIAVSGVFAPTSASIAFIVNGTITFSPSTTEARGIFIANSVDTGSTSNQGLKIVGNLVAQNNFINGRRWTNLSRPSLFIVFDQNQYLDLLPYLGTANYEWKQIN